MINSIEGRIEYEIIRLSANYKKRKVLHNGFNSGDLRRIQALVYVKTGLRRALHELNTDINNGERL